MNQPSNDSALNLFNNPETAPEKKLELAIAHVRDHGTIPTGTEWLWLQGTSVPIGEEPLLLALFDELDVQLLARLLGGFLTTKPDHAAIRGACEALLVVCRPDRTKRLALATFLDHPAMTGSALLQLLSCSRQLRERCFDYYPAGARGLPTRLRAILDDLPHEPALFRQVVDVLLDAKRWLPNDQRRIAGWRNVRGQLQQLGEILQTRPGVLAQVTRIPLVRRRRQLDEIGASLAEAGGWAMPDADYTSDTDGTLRAELLSGIAAVMLPTGHLPDGFQGRIADCLTGRPWLSVSAKRKPARPATPAPSPPAQPPSPVRVSVAPPPTGNATPRAVRPAIPPPAPAATTPPPVQPITAPHPPTSVPVAPTHPGPQSTSPDALLPASNHSPQPTGRQRFTWTDAAGFLSTYRKPATAVALAAIVCIGLVARMKSGVTNESDQALLGLLEGMSAEQLQQAADAEQRIALVSTALSIMPAQGVTPVGHFELLLKLPKEERQPALLRLNDQQMLGWLLANGSPAGRRALFEPLDKDQWNQLLDKLNGDGLTELLKQLSLDELHRLPLKQLARLQPADVIKVIYAQRRPAERNALLARFGSKTLASIVMQLDTVYQESLNDRLLSRLPDEDLVRLLQGFDGSRLKLLLTQVDEKRRHALDEDARKQIAQDESAEIQRLVALTITATPAIPPSDTTPGLVDQFVRGTEATRAALWGITGPDKLNELVAGLMTRMRADLIETAPVAQLARLSDGQLVNLVAAAPPDVMVSLLGKLLPQRRVEIVLTLKDDKLKQLASLDDPQLDAADTPVFFGTPQGTKGLARLLAFVPEGKLKSLCEKLKLTEAHVASLAAQSEKLASLLGEALAIDSGKNPEGHRIVYLELPAVPKAIDPSEHELGRIAPQAQIRGLELHGIGFMSRVGEQGLGAAVKQFKTKNRFEFEVNYHASKDDTAPLPLCKFWVEPQGDLKFVWHCEENQEYRLATEMIHCSVLEIDLLATGADSQFISFLKPIQIPKSLTVDPTRAAKNNIYWLLPEKHLLHLRGWPLLVSGLTVHVPRDGKRYSPTQEDLRNRMPPLVSFREDYKVGYAWFIVEEVVASGLTVPSIAMTVLPNKKSPQDAEEEDTISDTLNDLRRALAKATPTAKGRAATRRQGVLEIAGLLGISRPKDKDGTDFPYDSVNFRVFGERTMPEAANRRITRLEGELVTLSQRPTRIRDGLFESGLTISGSIYRVVGCEWARTTESKVEGGVLVKAFEIADRDPTP